MRRYWSALADSCRLEDRYHIHSILNPSADASSNPVVKKLECLWQRKVGYPWLIRKEFQGKIGHILDHSFAEMIRYLPSHALKVITVHDLIPLRYPGELTDQQLERFKKRVTYLSEADVLLAVSEYTKQELISLLGISPEKIHVVPNGVHMPDFRKRTPSWIEEKIAASCDGATLKIGSIGSILQRKNLEILPHALADFSTHSPGKKAILIRVGDKLPENLAHDIRAILGPHGLVELGILKDEELANFYQSIDVMVLPSLYEGFGLPLLEAMSWKVPVIASNTSSLPEVGGNDVIYFNPQHPHELGKSLADFALHGFPPERVKAAYQRAATFSWRKSLEGVFSAYDLAFQNKANV